MYWSFNQNNLFAIRNTDPSKNFKKAFLKIEENERIFNI